jgi:heat shock protein HtpX
VVLIGVQFVLLTTVVNGLLFPLHLTERCDEFDLCTYDRDISPSAIAAVALGIALYLRLAVTVARRAALRTTARPLGFSTRERQIAAIVEQISIASGEPVPTVLVLAEPSCNAFATRHRGRGVIILTEGSLHHLDLRQLRAVIAHEYGHLRHRDAEVMMVATFGVGAIAVLAVALNLTGVALMEQENDEGERPNAGLGLALWAVSLVIGLVALPLALVARASLSRRREWMADAAAVQYARDPTGLREALEVMGARSEPPVRATIATRGLFIHPPAPGTSAVGSLLGIMDSHPRLADRIAWLRELEGAGGSR